MSESRNEIIQESTSQPYKYGFVSALESDTLPKGLNEDIVRAISAKKQEPDFMLEFRLKAFRHWQTLAMPRWAH
ncbi:MAG: Fe-S cluster assembly protein SufB, partial [Bacteroidales bacterium]|nr:Fe-S cluster assembly protein SufB [Bacteroidales bacterium]